MTTRRLFRHSSASSRIRSALEAYRRPMDTCALAEAVGHSRQVTGRLLSVMARMGYIRRLTAATPGRYGHPATWCSSTKSDR